MYRSRDKRQRTIKIYELCNGLSQEIGSRGKGTKGAGLVFQNLKIWGNGMRSIRGTLWIHFRGKGGGACVMFREKLDSESVLYGFLVTL